MVEGLPSCDPGWGGGQSLVVGVLTVEVELVVTVLLLVVELGVVVGDWNWVLLKLVFQYLKLNFKTILPDTEMVGVDQEV